MEKLKKDIAYIHEKFDRWKPGSRKERIEDCISMSCQYYVPDASFNVLLTEEKFRIITDSRITTGEEEEAIFAKIDKAFQPLKEQLTDMSEWIEMIDTKYLKKRSKATNLPLDLNTDIPEQNGHGGGK